MLEKGKIMVVYTHTHKSKTRKTREINVSSLGWLVSQDLITDMSKNKWQQPRKIPI